MPRYMRGLTCCGIKVLAVLGRHRLVHALLCLYVTKYMKTIWLKSDKSSLIMVKRIEKKKSLLRSVVINVSTGTIVIAIILSSIFLYYLYNGSIDYSSKYSESIMADKAGEVENWFALHYNSGLQVTNAVENMAQQNNITREHVVTYLQEVFETNADLFGVYVAFEPNAFDNKDQEYVNTEYHDSSGRFLPYINKKTVEVLHDFERLDYYQKPKTTGKPFATTPYKYEVDGEEIEMISITLPIFSSEGSFIGIFGADITTGTIHKYLQGMKLYDGEAIMAIVDHTGRYVSHQNHILVNDSINTNCDNYATRAAKLSTGVIDKWTQKDEGNKVDCMHYPITVIEGQEKWALQGMILQSVKFKYLNRALLITVICAVVGLVIFIFIIRKYLINMIKPITILNNMAQTISEGDLRNDIDIKSDNEIGELAGSFNQMVIGLKSFISNVQNGAANVTVASSQVNSSAQELNQQTNEQASIGEEISSNMEEMASSVQQNAEKSANISTASKTILEVMEEIGEQSRKVNELQDKVQNDVATIEELAQQTKILSLNAAVEAARAGEHGRGFAVVAREVQKLSENTTNLSRAINDATGLSTNEALESYNNFKKAMPLLKSLNSDIETISIASQEQAANVEQVNNAVQLFNSATQSNASSAEELASTGEELNQQSETLQELTTQYIVND